MANRYKKWLNLPDKYQLVVGDTFELFYRGIVLASDPYSYNIKVKCKKGSAFMRKYVYTPAEEDVGSYTLNIELSDDDGDVLDEKNVELVVNPKPVSPKEDTYILCIGDSITAGGVWPSECFRRLTGTGGEPEGLGLERVHFAGSREGKFGARYEGYGGWRFEEYNYGSTARSLFKYIITNHNKTDCDRHSIYTDGVSEWKLEEIEDGRIKVIATVSAYRGPLAESGVLRHVSGGENHEDIEYSRVDNASGNPFWNLEADRVDFTAYAKKLGVPRFDICVVILGWNSWSQNENKIKTEARTLMNNIRRDLPDCKIVLVGPHTTSSQDGLGTSYGTLFNYMDKLEFAFSLDGWYREIAKEYSEMYYVNMAGQFDTEYNYPTVERKANVRSQKTVIMQSNGLHPTENGYRQIGDIVYRQLSSMLQGE